MRKTSDPDSNWYVCQIGAREHYSIARAVHARSRLKALITDGWSDPRSPTRYLSQQFGQRFHPELADARVEASTLRSLVHKFGDKAQRRSGWDSIMERNAWFGRWAANRIVQTEKRDPSKDPIVFSYSYAAREIFRAAKPLGMRTILGQIDPGPAEARMVRELYAQAGQPEENELIPEDYWTLWREELELADTIVVNSEWSAGALRDENVDPAKIKIVPLALNHAVPSFERSVPAEFTPERPLRLLFLGQVTLRKGIQLVFEAISEMPGAPIAIDVVGDLQVTLPDEIKRDPRISFHGRVSRSQVWSHYQQADVFLFPTFSDGFGLTQLEALAAGLPVISSTHCGAVVRNGHNGLVLEQLTSDHLIAALQDLLDDPKKIEEWQQNCTLEERFTLPALTESLFSLSGEGRDREKIKVIE